MNLRRSSAVGATVSRFALSAIFMGCGRGKRFHSGFPVVFTETMRNRREDEWEGAIE